MRGVGERVLWFGDKWVGVGYWLMLTVAVSSSTFILAHK
jgi:hypothetical protein